MAFTEEFYKILRSKKRILGEYESMHEALEEAEMKGVPLFRDRKKRYTNIKFQNNGYI